MTHRTRIKICGLTREQDLLGAIGAGADAVGFVFYLKSPRYIAPDAAGRLIARISPFVMPVGLFVNASLKEVTAVLAHAPVSILQFHGDETPAQCATIAAAVNRPFMRVVRVKPEMTADNLLECESVYCATSTLFSSLLLDAYVDSYGGSGKVFDWSLIPESLAPRVVLSGGLNAQNATEAVQRIRPHAVDVSSGVEEAKGIKDVAKIRAFISTVRTADATRTD